MAVIEYDGTGFAGSQVQADARTVQGELEEALNRLTGERTRVRFAGRTDAGVHATGQVAAFRLPAAGRSLEGGWAGLRQRLNALLPDDVVIRSLRSVPPGFDPRRDARWRVYRYRVRPGGRARPLDRHRTLEIDEQLDVTAMRAAAERLVGERDFAALGSHSAGRTVRRIAVAEVARRGGVVEIRVVADAFLRRMVRAIVAVLLEVGRGRISPGEVDRLLASGQRALHGRAAPPRGLTLERVIYERSQTDERGENNRRTGEQST